MNRIISTAAIFVATALCCQAQTLSEILQSIAQNSPELRSAQWEQQAQVEDIKAQARLANPEVEFNYLWSNESTRRHDFRLTQSFDLALLSGQRAKEAAAGKELLAIEYRALRQQVLLEAEKTCIDIVFCNALIEELEKHLHDAETIAQAYKRKAELGEASVLEQNNAALHLSNVSGKLKKAELERKRLLLDLAAMNCGNRLDISTSDIDSFYADKEYVLPEDFREYFDKAAELSPALAYVKQQIEISNYRLGIEKSMRMPELTLGYMAEVANPEAYRGITIGISIPVWDQSTKIRKAKAEVEAAKSRKNEAVQAYYFQLASNFHNAVGLQDISRSYRESLDKSDNREYLKKAQAQGEISVIEYISELELFYENIEGTLSAEREFRLALAELTAVFL